MLTDHLEKQFTKIGQHLSEKEIPQYHHTKLILSTLYMILGTLINLIKEQNLKNENTP